MKKNITTSCIQNILFLSFVFARGYYQTQVWEHTLVQSDFSFAAAASSHAAAGVRERCKRAFMQSSSFAVNPLRRFTTAWPTRWHKTSGLHADEPVVLTARRKKEASNLKSLHQPHRLILFSLIAKILESFGLFLYDAYVCIVWCWGRCVGQATNQAAAQCLIQQEEA
jgi:hypothetical protein